MDLVPDAQEQGLRGGHAGTRASTMQYTFDQLLAFNLGMHRTSAARRGMMYMVKGRFGELQMLVMRGIKMHGEFCPSDVRLCHQTAAPPVRLICVSRFDHTRHNMEISPTTLGV